MSHEINNAMNQPSSHQGFLQTAVIYMNGTKRFYLTMFHLRLL